MLQLHIADQQWHSEEETLKRKQSHNIRESLPQFGNQIMARVYIRSITRSTMYQKALFC